VHCLNTLFSKVWFSQISCIFLRFHFLQLLTLYFDSFKSINQSFSVTLWIVLSFLQRK
jgi:hypothetical protein